VIEGVLTLKKKRTDRKNPQRRKSTGRGVKLGGEKTKWAIQNLLPYDLDKKNPIRLGGKSFHSRKKAHRVEKKKSTSDPNGRNWSGKKSLKPSLLENKKKPASPGEPFLLEHFKERITAFI